VGQCHGRAAFRAGWQTGGRFRRDEFPGRPPAAHTLAFGPAAPAEAVIRAALNRSVGVDFGKVSSARRRNQFAREWMAPTVRLSFTAIKAASIPEDNSDRNRSSSSCVQGRPAGRGPVISYLPSLPRRIGWMQSGPKSPAEPAAIPPKPGIFKRKGGSISTTDNPNWRVGADRKHPQASGQNAGWPAEGFRGEGRTTKRSASTPSWPLVWAVTALTGDHRHRGHRFDCRPSSGRHEAPGADPTITSPEAV